MAAQPLLLISRNDLREAAEGSGGDHLVRQLARLTRQGFHLLSVASQPDDWSGKDAVSRRSLPAGRSTRQRVTEAGGHLDGVYYIPRSMLTQKKKRLDALHDIMTRFSMEASNVYLLSSGSKLLGAAESLGIKTLKVGRKAPLTELLDTFFQLQRP